MYIRRSMGYIKTIGYAGFFSLRFYMCDQELDTFAHFERFSIHDMIDIMMMNC